MDLQVHSLTPIPTSVLTFMPYNYDDVYPPSMDLEEGTGDIPSLNVQ